MSPYGQENYGYGATNYSQIGEVVCVFATVLCNINLLTENNCKSKMATNDFITWTQSLCPWGQRNWWDARTCTWSCAPPSPGLHTRSCSNPWTLHDNITARHHETWHYDIMTPAPVHWVPEHALHRTEGIVQAREDVLKGDLHGDVGHWPPHTVLVDIGSNNPRIDLFS